MNSSQRVRPRLPPAERAPRVPCLPPPSSGRPAACKAARSHPISPHDVLSTRPGDAGRPLCRGWRGCARHRGHHDCRTGEAVRQGRTGRRGAGAAAQSTSASTASRAACCRCRPSRLSARCAAPQPRPCPRPRRPLSARLAPSPRCLERAGVPCGLQAGQVAEKGAGNDVHPLQSAALARGEGSRPCVGATPEAQWAVTGPRSRVRPSPWFAHFPPPPPSSIPQATRPHTRRRPLTLMRCRWVCLAAACMPHLWCLDPFDHFGPPPSLAPCRPRWMPPSRPSTMTRSGSGRSCLRAAKRTQRAGRWS